MYQRIKILNSKLLLPCTTDAILRERLNPLLAEIPKKRLTTVIAGAGYGKTTFISKVSEYSGLNTVWYSLDNSDKDFLPFISYLIAGIKKYFPSLGAETDRRIEESQNYSLEREAIITVFLSEIEKFVKDDLIIVLDDYHTIKDSQEINESLTYLIEYLSPSIHLVIISRNDPDIHLSRYRARREVLDIREGDLVFAVPEIVKLYSQLFDISLQDKNVKILHQKTEGWISGLILFYHSLRKKSPYEIDELLLKLKGSHRIIFNYLEENVYDLQREEIKDFLIKTSILSRVKAEFCNQFLRLVNSRDILKGLEKNHLFTFPFDAHGEWYYYHHLFQDFLQKKLEYEHGREAMLILHRDAAILWEEEGEDEEALKHYLMANQPGKACVLLRKLGMKLIEEGRIHSINSYLKKIPESYLNKEPWVQYTRAIALELSRKPQQAISAYQKAQNTFHKYEDMEGVILCLNSLGYNYYLTGDLPRAQIKLKELLNHAKDNPSYCIDILGHLLEISSHLGEMKAADQYFNRAIILLNKMQNMEQLAWLNINQGMRFVYSGDFNKALDLGEQARNISENHGLYLYLFLSYTLISFSCYWLGHFVKGLENAGKGLGLVIGRGMHGASHAMLLFCSGLNAAALGKIDDAIENGDKSLKVFQRMGNRWGQAMAYYLLHGAYIKAGNLQAAEEYARSGLDLIDGLVLPMEEGLLKLGLAVSLIEMDRLEEVLPLLEGSEKLLKSSKLNAAMVCLQFARFHWVEKQKEAALNRLLSGLQLCKENQYDIWIILEKHWIIPLLVEIFVRGKMQNYIQEILKKIGSFAQEELTLLQRNNNPLIRKAAYCILYGADNVLPPGLRVYCFGEFRIFSGNDEITAVKWKSKKAKMLFKILLNARSRGYLSKEVLMGLLWPGGEPEKTVFRLHVALTALRKILEPDILKGTPSLYILRDEDSYKLDIGDDGWVDVDEFQEELKLAREEKEYERSILHYMNAESIYCGDFLEEDIYIEWCGDVRERLRRGYLDSLTQIMEFYEKKHDYAMCIEYARKYLKTDKYAEKIYQQLMKYYYQIGNRSMVTKTFERCKEKIIKELESPLNKETELLYQELALM